MLHFDSDASRVVIRLPVRPALSKVIPAYSGYANLSGHHVHPDVLQLVWEWRQSGRVTTVFESSEYGDCAVLNQGLTVYRLAAMNAEWSMLQHQLLGP